MKEAYRLRRWAIPDLATIEQCKNDESIERTNLALKEGCQIYGYMEVNRVSRYLCENNATLRFEQTANENKATLFHTY